MKKHLNLPRMKTLEIDYTIPSELLCAMTNADVSGLCDAEIDAIDDLETEATQLVVDNGGTHYCWQYDPNEEPSFSSWHDADQLGAADCIDVTLVIFLED